MTRCECGHSEGGHEPDGSCRSYRICGCTGFKAAVVLSQKSPPKASLVLLQDVLLTLKGEGSEIVIQGYPTEMEISGTMDDLRVVLGIRVTQAVGDDLNARLALARIWAEAESEGGWSSND